MTIHAAPVVGDPAPEQAEQAAGLPVLAAAAVSTLATRMSLLVVPWLLLAGDAGWQAVGLVSAAQVLAYLLAGPLAVALADRLRPMRLAVSADLLSAPALAGIAYFALPDSALAARSGLPGAVGLGVLAALAGALRSIGDRARDAVRRDVTDDGARPPRSGLVRALQVLAVLAGERRRECSRCVWARPGCSGWTPCCACSARRCWCRRSPSGRAPTPRRRSPKCSAARCCPPRQARPRATRRAPPRRGQMTNAGRPTVTPPEQTTNGGRPTATPEPWRKRRPRAGCPLRPRSWATRRSTDGSLLRRATALRQAPPTAPTMLQRRPTTWLTITRRLPPSGPATAPSRVDGMRQRRWVRPATAGRRCRSPVPRLATCGVARWRSCGPTGWCAAWRPCCS
ncbi:hypothetical protein ACFQZ4_16865 [Catellatospora coxensis]